MNSATPIPAADLPELGQPFAGGILAAVGHRLDVTKHALVTAIKDGDPTMTWDEAVAFCASLGEGWTLPSLEDGVLLRRNGMPRLNPNWNPGQTKIEAFKQGGPEAFETDNWYWLEQASAYFAWCLNFYYGTQTYRTKSSRLRVRAVREIILI